MTIRNQTYDAIIVGAGVSGSFMAHALTQAGLRCVVLEAGKDFNRHNYPRTEVDGNSQLYWGGGIELDTHARIGFLRAKVVGGGSVVNQALMDRFDDLALDSWREASGVRFFTRADLDPYYDRAAAAVVIQQVPEQFRNGNAEIFQRGFAANGYRWAPLQRAQADCRFEDGNCCIECLNGCPIDSKQSMTVTVLRRAREAGCTVIAEFEARRVTASDDGVSVSGLASGGTPVSYHAKYLVLGGGAIGNGRLLLASGFDKRLPALGHHFYTHPQYMTLGVYDHPINAHRGPMQSYKSDDPNFRKSGFKLENVFAPPVAIAMLVPRFGRAHQRRMRQITHFACVEVAVRDTNPGRIHVGRHDTVKIEKTLNAEDQSRRNRGLQAIRNIFLATGAKDIIEGDLAVGLHLMGGCNMGTDPQRSVTAPDFRLHGFRNVYVADSSIFPNAPGINPSFTIMALSIMGGDQMLKDLRA